MRKKKVASMMLYLNGNIAAIDSDGQQIATLQTKSAIELWVEYAVKAGFDLDGCAVSAAHTRCRIYQSGESACLVQGGVWPEAMS